MPRLVACRVCNGQVSSQADRCPHCRQKNPYRPYLLAGIAALLLMLAAVAVYLVGPPA